MKLGNLMELPPTVLTDDLFIKGNQAIPYPAPLLELWKKSTQPHYDLPSSKSFELPLRYFLLGDNLGTEIHIIL